MDKFSVLKEVFGHTQFRHGQSEIIDNILASRDVLGIMPTGAGKSICYQVPALMLEGITLVISPLISLMKDQVNALVQSGVKASYINSSLTPGQSEEVFRRALAGRYKIIYVAPERLVTEKFINFAEQTKISMVTVDEAHCVSQWGQDFRPPYLKIVEFIEKLSYRPIISAFTATATKEVREDITCILRLNNPFVITTGFNRKNLSFAVQKPKDKFKALLEILNRNSEASGIIYCSTRKTVEEVCNTLNKNGYPATRYHAGLNDSERAANQDDFIYDRKPVMVATNAFGMGIDKSNVSFVVHYNMPKNLESYYQEAGRAGRDGEPAECILLYSGQDVITNRFLIDHSEDNPELTAEMRQEVRKREHERLKEMTFYCATSNCLREYILRYFGEYSANFCGNCSNCLTNFESVDITVEAQKIISCVYRVAQNRRSFGKTMIADIVHGSRNEKIKRFKLDTLSTYGIMADVPVHRIRSMIDFLIENNYLVLTQDEYPVIKPAERAGEIIREKKPVFMKLPKQSEPDKPSQDPVVHAAIDTGLFQALKELRNRLAAEAHVPAYIIFADAALRDMCRKLPQSNEQFLHVSGVGKAKMEKYGERFTGLIKSYLSGHPEVRNNQGAELRKNEGAEVRKKQGNDVQKNQGSVQKTQSSKDTESEPSYRERVISNGLHSAYNSWTSAEDTQLREEFERGLAVKEISGIHNRTRGAITSRLKKLGLLN